MTEIKRHKFDELYNSYFKTVRKDGLRIGSRVTYTLFERCFDLDGRAMMEPAKMVALQQEGNIVVLCADNFSEEFLKTLTEWNGKMSEQAVSGLAEVPKE